jgi:hypothetical protein
MKLPMMTEALHLPCVPEVPRPLISGATQKTRHGRAVMVMAAE